jgi:SAM-dependent methyltransferase
VLADRWFDLRYGVDTCGTVALESLHIIGDNRAHGHRYEPARVVELRRTFARLRDAAGPDTLVIDLGSGKGRILMVAAEFGFERAVGVEFAAELCEVARRNISQFQRYAAGSTQLSVHEGDVLGYEFPECDTVFFMFNPFDEAITKGLFGRLNESLIRRPRRIWVCLYNTGTAEIIERVTSLKVIEQKDHYGYKSVILSNAGSGR